jgi:hypothetical protein
VTTYQSRWGYHPVDYATFCLLRKLSARYWRAVRRAAAWRRWARKAPHNRPGPEPGLDPLFCERAARVVGGNGRSVPDAKVSDRGVRHALQVSRAPAARPEDVYPVGLSAATLAAWLATPDNTLAESSPAP